MRTNILSCIEKTAFFGVRSESNYFKNTHTSLRAHMWEVTENMTKTDSVWIYRTFYTRTFECTCAEQYARVCECFCGCVCVYECDSKKPGEQLKSLFLTLSATTIYYYYIIVRAERGTSPAGRFVFKNGTFRPGPLVCFLLPVLGTPFDNAFYTNGSRRGKRKNPLRFYPTKKKQHRKGGDGVRSFFALFYTRIVVS